MIGWPSASWSSDFQPTVFAVALARLRNPAEAQELAQEVFLHGMKKLPQLRETAAFAGWLRQITVRMAINRLTRRGHLQRAEGEVLDNAQATGGGPLDALVRTEQAAELHKGLERAEADRPCHPGGLLPAGADLEADEP